eukprot:TRINITY_DN70230_c0_g1_i1.p1 TRINITY_DN70230_c0_g1~~TRINITY_DN70230_c0_g1_i1.p1  ORF type:complete len:238 (-),score=3.22 TRINITY_DN70230_c0_g1_i1:162-875(-)
MPSLVGSEMCIRDRIGKNGWDKFVDSHLKFYAWLLKTTLWHAPADDQRTLVIATSQLEYYEKMGNPSAIVKGRQLATNYMRLNTFKGRITTAMVSSIMFSKREECNKTANGDALAQARTSSCLSSYGKSISPEAGFFVYDKRRGTPSGNYLIDSSFSDNQVYMRTNPLNELLGIVGSFDTMMMLYFDNRVSSPTDHLTILLSSQALPATRRSQALPTTRSIIISLTTTAALMVLFTH